MKTVLEVVTSDAIDAEHVRRRRASSCRRTQVASRLQTTESFPHGIGERFEPDGIGEFIEFVESDTA